ncbi:hypothetical protein NN561_007227 [Cricetulus griseus]
MRLSVPALRRTRAEMFVNYIRGAFIAPEPGVTKKPPPPPQTESGAPGTPVSRRPGGDGRTSPEISGSASRGCGAREGYLEPQSRSDAAAARARARAPLPAPPSRAQGLSVQQGRLQLFRMRGGDREGAGPRLGLRSRKLTARPGNQ